MNIRNKLPLIGDITWIIVFISYISLKPISTLGCLQLKENDKTLK